MDLLFLKDSIDYNEKYQKKNKKQKYLSNRLLSIVEKFIVKHNLVCYGGTAINNILPKSAQFYDYDIEIPDYDFFSTNAIQHAKELCNILSNENVYHVEGKNAFFLGTYKVFVNFIPVADITQIDEKFYNYLMKNNIKVNDIMYTSPQYLKMSLHHELSRPLGDVSRWEKVYKRMMLLYQHYPTKTYKLTNKKHLIEYAPEDNIHSELLDHFMKNKYVICNLDLVHSIWKDKNYKYKNEIHIVYVDNLKNASSLISKKYGLRTTIIESQYKFIGNYSFVEYDETIIAILVHSNTCVAYIEQEYDNKKIRIPNMDSALSLYYSLLMMEDIPIVKSTFLYYISKFNQALMNYEKFVDKHIYSRFNLPCYGKQEDFQSVFYTRNKTYKKLSKQKTSKEYQKWFFKYVPQLKYKTSMKKSNNKKNKTIKRNKQ
jgi:hypothetical protein